MGTAVLDLVLSQVWIVHVSEGIGPLVLVLLDIGLVDPAQRVHEHVIESRSNVSHERHEEEGRLKDMVGEQLECVDEAIVPRCLIKVEEESQDTNADLDRKDLHQCNDKNEVSFFLVSGIRDRGQRREGRGGKVATDGDGDEETNRYAGSDSQGCLSVVIIGEDFGIL